MFFASGLSVHNCFGPAVSRHVQKVKVARVKTTHPKVGMDLKNRVMPPTDRVKAILSKLGDLPREAEEKARTIEELRRRIRELERQCKALLSLQIDQKQVEAAEQRGYARAQREYEHQSSQLLTRLERIARLAQVGEIETPEVRQSPIAPRLPNPPRRPNTDGGTSLNRCERAVLSLLWNNPQRQFKKTIVGLFTGYSHKSGGFNNALCHLNSLGLIQRLGEGIQISTDGTDHGEELLGSDTNLHEAFTIENWAQKLPRCESMIFQYVMGNSGTEFTKEELGEATGYQPNSGGFNNAICRLNSLGLIVRKGGRIQLNSEILESR
jgi:hypothetical protein